MSKFSPKAYEAVYKAIGGKTYAASSSPEALSPMSFLSDSDASMTGTPRSLSPFLTEKPKIRSAGALEKDRYEVIGSKADSEDGTAAGELARKKPSSKDHAADSRYYATTMLKINDGIGNHLIKKNIQEVVAAHLLNLAGWDEVTDTNPNFSKVFFGKGPDAGLRVGVRFHPDFRSLADIQKTSSALEGIDCGKALAQTFWIGDTDGHSGNIGVVGDSKTALRIDLDGAFSKTPLSEIIETGSINEEDTYPTFRDSLSQESFATELDRLGNMDYSLPGSGLTQIIDTVIASYKEHSPSPLSPAVEEEIRQNIASVIKTNSDQMKFLAEMAKINVILKKDTDLTIDDRTKIMEASSKIKEIKESFKARGEALPRLVDQNMGDIFALANTSISKKLEALTIVGPINPELAVKMRKSCETHCNSELTHFEASSVAPTESRASAGAGDGAPASFKTYVPRRFRTDLAASASVRSAAEVPIVNSVTNTGPTTASATPDIKAPSDPVKKAYIPPHLRGGSSIGR